MAKRLEESLYRSAPSFEAYNDISTLKQRLQQLAMNIGMKTKKMQQAQVQAQAQAQAQLAQQQKQQTQAQQQQFQTEKQQLILQHQPQQRHPTSTNGMKIQPLKPNQPQIAPQPSQIQVQSQSQPQQRTMVNMSDINPIMSATAQSQHVAAPASGNIQSSSAIGSSAVGPQSSISANAPQNALSSQTTNGHPHLPKQSGSVPSPAPTSAAGNAPVSSSAGSRPGSDRQQVLRHQQQRLLLLRHAAKCPHEDGRCPVTPHCAGMKRLWKHIAECKDQKCLVPHCVSSRYVLSHYHRCKDPRCPVCGPVREAIHRSHEKQKQMQALKQRHQTAMKQSQATPGTPASSSDPARMAIQQSTTPSEVQSSTKRRKIETPAVGTTPMASNQVAAQPLAPSHPAYIQPQQQLSQQKIPSHSGGKAGYSYSQAPGTVPTQVPMAAPPGGPAKPIYKDGQVIMPKQSGQSGPKPKENHTLINCFTIEQIETHIASLSTGLQLTPQKLKVKCLEVMRILQSHQHGWVFNTPVDPVELGLPDYFEVIKRPMDLGTIKKRLENGCYHALDDFEGDVCMTFDNAMLYNPEGSVVFNMAKEMKVKFEVDFKDLVKQLNIEEEEKRKNGDACSLCGCEKLLFEPPIFYCNGMNCPSKRIRRNSYYYVGGNNQYHWCHQCFGELRENQNIDMGDLTLKKNILVKKKNDEVHEESWVQCDKCERWIHQICGLFNTRQNKDQRSEYTCPRCTIGERKKNGVSDGTSTTPMAEDLPRTKLSERLESHVREKMKEKLSKMATDKAKADNIPLEDATKAIAMGGPITIRQVASMDRKLEVRERMKRRYAFKNYPSEFTFRCKCIVVFQNLDGVDVVLFGLYVYEHDENNPGPNPRSVYVSYLDSVHYMRPRKMRTFIYHEILISYLDYVRCKGFSTAHIWACPPLKGDDYILYAKPEDQKTPKDDRLRQWYIDMLIECQRRGIVGRLTNMYDLYFANEKNDATAVPYMDGDYFPAEVENIIKDLEEGKHSKKSNVTGSKKKKGSTAKNKNKSGRGGTRSTGIDEDALAASGMIPPGVQTKSLQEGGRDYVMAKLGETIQPMKESFIVAFLNWSGVKEENTIVPKEIQEYREKHGISTDFIPIPSAVEKEKMIENSDEEKDGKSTAIENSDSPNKKSENKEPSEKKEGENAVTKTSAVSSTPQKEKSDIKDKTEFQSTSSSATPIEQTPSGSTSDNAGNGIKVEGDKSGQSKKEVIVREGKFAAMEARKRDSEGKTKVESNSESKPESKPDSTSSSSETAAITVKDSQGRIVKVTDDDIEEMDCEFLNNRQAFLNLCQGNHYQFDQLRRAKHTSMMVLWHLHNRDAPKFVQQCAVCSREILTGYRYHCPTCADYDQCHDCLSNPNTPRHPHQLKAIPVASGQQSELTEAQRKERQRSIQLHMTLLLHAATCVSSKCPSANCTKMKGLLKHGTQCQIKATGGCHVCKRIWTLLQIHARQCKQKTCPVPNCMAIRERFRQLTLQQQAMDDRRRQEMNRAYAHIDYHGNQKDQYENCVETRLWIAIAN
eukprot:scaffold348462_cov62-Attheya_sp.AAC.4